MAFGFHLVNVQDISMEYEGFECHIILSKYLKRFKKAQTWLDKTLMAHMQPVIPYRTGKFLGRIINANAPRYGTGKLIVTLPPQGRRLYSGISQYGRPIHYTNPRSVPYWGMEVYKRHEPELKDGIKRIIRGENLG